MIKLRLLPALVLLTNLFLLATPAFADSPYPSALLTTPSSSGAVQVPQTAVQSGSSSNANSTAVGQFYTEFQSEIQDIKQSARTAVPTNPVPVTAAVPSFPKLTDFAASVGSGQPGIVQGVYVADVMAVKVVQQPAGNAGYIAATASVVTQFSLAAQFGTTGLIAHNYSAGAYFSHLSSGQEVDVVYGDGAVRKYAVSQIRHFRAMRPSDPYSPFVDLDKGGANLTSTDVFNQVYSGGNRVVFQTCITGDGDPAWGRLFVTAMPIQ